MPGARALTGEQAAGAPRRPSPALARIGAIVILLLLVIGCLVLWLGVPAGGMWLSAKLTDSFGWHMPVALAIIVPGMLVVSAGLAWLNGLYLRVTGGRMVIANGAPIRRRGPLEPLLIATMLLALCAFVAWFFFLAENPALTA